MLPVVHPTNSVALLSGWYASDVEIRCVFTHVGGDVHNVVREHSMI